MTKNIIYLLSTFIHYYVLKWHFWSVFQAAVTQNQTDNNQQRPNLFCLQLYSDLRDVFFYLKPINK